MHTNKFYDIHFHAMDLSHANITAFMDRYINNPNEIKKILKGKLPWWKKVFGSLSTIILPLLGPFVRYSFIAKEISKFLKKQVKIRNLLSFMESSVLYDFLIVEYFLKHGHKNENPILVDNKLIIEDKTYDKIVLCPLIMDFGYPNIHNDDIYYNIPPQKPITSQITDLFKSIRTYYEKDLEINNDNPKLTKFDVKDSKISKDKKLFEIFPFMGINTKNYNYEDIKKMLDKYFVDFSNKDTAVARYNKLFKAMGEFDGDLDDPKKCKNIFAGIKLYPPLGFEPWPDQPKVQGVENERAKVKLIYDRCLEKNIPIITHCSTGGFVASLKAKEYTNPNGQWSQLLQEEDYYKLKIDFAHFGSDDSSWTSKIIQYALDDDRNVFADFSCNADNPAYYKELKSIINDEKLNDHILYGSDFMINLLKINSLNEYMQYFIETEHLTSIQKHKFVNTNPEKFLFG